MEELKQVGCAETALAKEFTPPEIKPRIVLPLGVKCRTNLLSMLQLRALDSTLLTPPLTIPLLCSPKATLIPSIMILPSVGLTISIELLVTPYISPYLCVRLRFTRITLNFGMPYVILIEVPL